MIEETIACVLNHKGLLNILELKLRGNIGSSNRNRVKWIFLRASSFSMFNMLFNLLKFPLYKYNSNERFLTLGKIIDFVIRKQCQELLSTVSRFTPHHPTHPQTLPVW